MSNYKKWADIVGGAAVILGIVFIVPSWIIGPQKYDLVVAYGYATLLALQVLLLTYAIRKPVSQ